MKRNLDLTRVDAEILIFLRNGFNRIPNTASKIHYSLKTTQSHISLRINILQEKKFIYNEEGSDNRIKPLHLTEKGKKVADLLFKLKKILK